MYITVTYTGITAWYVGMGIYALSDKVSPAMYAANVLYCPKLYCDVCINYIYVLYYIQLGE